MYSPKPSLQWSQIPVWVRVAVAVLALDIALFYLGSLILGGDAARGYSQDGKYFLTGNGHATEVSRAVYYYSNIHLVSIAFAMLWAGIGLKRVSVKANRR